jgi:hypothetical protein
MRHRLLSPAVVAAVALASNVCALSGTKGTPIGGMGTGYVVYDGKTGLFGVSGKMPPPAADGVEKQISSSGFHFFAGTETKARAKAESEDAKCPIYSADFGTIGGVKFTLTAFGPFLPGDGADNFKLATSPLAFFEITGVNSGTAAIDAAVAMEFANGGLLGGANSGTAETGGQAISFAGTSDNAYLAVDCDGATPTYYAGSLGTFSTDGTLGGGDGNLVGAKCNLAAGGTVHFKFTLAWYRGWGTENYWYHNNFTDSKAAATFGRSKFDAVKTGITSFVNRTMASNFPEWYKDRLLNNTYPLIHNAQCAKDGRIAFWEGKYGIIGTIDQGEHASLFYTMNWPDVQWHELQYWNRSARQDDAKGQIHHDVNQGISSFTAGSDASRHMLAWDNWNHQDYWWFPNTTTWADLNCMFIFKAYELMLATGNLDSMKTYYKAIQRTVERILVQCGANSKLPLNCHSTYDESTDGGKTFNTSPEYNGGVVLPTYLAAAEIAKFCGDTATASTYRGYYTTGRAEYKAKFATAATYATGRDASEGDVAGYSWARYFCFEPVMDKDFILGAHTKLWNHYKNRTESNVDATRSKLGKWGFYTCDHWGGVEIAIGKPDTALIIHKWDHQYYYVGAPNMVFWQNLRKEQSERNTYASYMTAPTVWRSYFQMIGYMIDNANKRLWIRPSLPTLDSNNMGGKITKALLLNPKALGTLDYDENPSGDRTQTMTVSFDAPVSIREFVLKNNTGGDAPGVQIINAGQKVALASSQIKAEGSDLELNIRVTLTDPIQIGPEGVTINVYKSAAAVKGAAPTFASCPLALGTRTLKTGSPIRFSVDRGGPLTMELIGLNGAKLGIIMQSSMSVGNHSFVWNGKTASGRVAAGMTLLRMTSSSGSSVTRPVVIAK